MIGQTRHFTLAFVTAAVLFCAPPAPGQTSPARILDQDGRTIRPPGRGDPEAPPIRSETARAEDQSFAARCSTSYCLQQSTLNTAGLQVTSLSYALNASLGQELTTGSSSSNLYVLQSGFWGWFGTTLVPVVLMVSKTPADPDLPKLDWSGNNPPYTIYRATNCALIFFSEHGRTSLKTYVDEMPPAEALTCYNILATPPVGGYEALAPDPSGAVRHASDYESFARGPARETE